MLASCITAQCVDDTNPRSKKNMKICMNKQIKNEQRNRLNTSDNKYCGNYGVVGLTNKKHTQRADPWVTHPSLRSLGSESFLYRREEHGHAGQENASNTKETEPEMGKPGVGDGHIGGDS